MTLTSKTRATKNRGVRTDGGRVDNIQEELRNVINLMGSADTRTDDEHDNSSSSQPTASIIEIHSDDKNAIQKLVQKPDAKPISVANTPRDYSELSSLGTDSIAVYIDNNKPSAGGDFEPLLCNVGVAGIDKKVSELGLKIRNPIHKISSLLGMNMKPTHTQINEIPQTSHQQNQNIDLYRINILQPKSESAPKRVIFDLVEDMPPNRSNVATNTSPRSRRRQKEAQLLYRNMNCKNESQQPLVNSNTLPTAPLRSDPIIDASARMQKKTIYQRTSTNKIPGQLDCVTRVDVYYFDHGNSAYYHTTDCPPVIMTEIIAEKTETYTTKFWAETFGFVHILFSFITSFILQLIRSILQSFVRPLTVGVLQITSDYCIKPLLATIFNALIQPPLIFIYNVATTMRDICDPLAEGMGYFIREIATIFGAIRLVEVKRYCGDTRSKRKHDCGIDPEQNIQA